MMLITLMYTCNMCVARRETMMLITLMYTCNMCVARRNNDADHTYVYL